MLTLLGPCDSTAEQLGPGRRGPIEGRVEEHHGELCDSGDSSDSGDTETVVMIALMTSLVMTSFEDSLHVHAL